LSYISNFIQKYQDEEVYVKKHVEIEPMKNNFFTLNILCILLH